jgi:hypothetical protein
VSTGVNGRDLYFLNALIFQLAEMKTRIGNKKECDNAQRTYAIVILLAELSRMEFIESADSR